MSDEFHTKLSSVKIFFEVDQMHFDLSSRAVDRGTNADVHHTRMQDIILDFYEDRVHSVGRDDLLRMGDLQISRWKSDRTATTVACDHLADLAVSASQLRRRCLIIARFDRSADFAR